MKDKEKREEKKLSLKEQLQQDIANFDKQIELIAMQIEQLKGAKVYAKSLIERIRQEKEEKEEKEKKEKEVNGK